MFYRLVASLGYDVSLLLFFLPSCSFYLQLCVSSRSTLCFVITDCPDMTLAVSRINGLVNAHDLLGTLLHAEANFMIKCH